MFYTRNLKTLAQLEATFAYYSNQDILQTATASQVVESASAAMAQASATIQVIHQSSNLYGGLTPSYGGNLALAVILGFFSSYTHYQGFGLNNGGLVLLSFVVVD